MACLRGQLAGAVPDGAGIYPVSLQGLRQGCIAARVPGADAPLQVSQYLHMSAKIVLAHVAIGHLASISLGSWDLRFTYMNIAAFTTIVQMHYHCPLA